MEKLENAMENLRVDKCVRSRKKQTQSVLMSFSTMKPSHRGTAIKTTTFLFDHLKNLKKKIEKKEEAKDEIKIK